MRQRKVKNLSEKLGQVSEWLIENPLELKGSWRSMFRNEGSLFLEIGCGRGKFINQHAAVYPSQNYIGIEGQASVILRAAEKAMQNDCGNVKFVNAFVNDLGDLFAVNELDGIYLNFSDPWPKARHAKRRLTDVSRLENYKKVLKIGAFIEIKTDNDALFAFTIEQIAKAGFTVEEMTTDLQASTFTAKNITTEYEDKFHRQGKNINYIKIRA